MSKSTTNSYLDTSVFLEYVKHPLLQSSRYLNQVAGAGRRSASSYSIMELNKRFLVLAIDYYQTIEKLRDVGSAKIELSNRWGRAPKYYLIFDGLVERNKTADYKNDFRAYLALLEMVIIDTHDRLISLAHNYNGDFLKHPLFKVRLTSKDDFAKLNILAKSYDKKDYIDIWRNDTEQLNQAIAYFEELSLTKKLNKTQAKIFDLVRSLKQNDPIKSWEHMGDLLISLNSPKSYTLLAHDKLFTILCEMLAKRTLYVDFAEI